MNGERHPGLDELIPADTPDAERQRLQHVHELLLQADPPPELSPELEAGPNLGLTLDRRRRAAKARAMVLLAAAITVGLVFLGGYAVGNRQHQAKSAAPVANLVLKGTSLEPHAQATLEVWHPRHGNWPMTLSVVGLSQLPPRRYYEVYVVRHGKILRWARCGMFRASGSPLPLVVTLNAPYPLQHGDSWVVTREGPGGVEPGQTVLRPIKA